MKTKKGIKNKIFERAALVRRSPKLPLYHTSPILSIDKLHKNQKYLFPEIVHFDEK